MSRGGLLLAIVAGFGLRLHAALTPPPDVSPDERAYMSVARELYERGHFDAGASDLAPGAPLLYGAIFHLAGGVDPRAVLLVLAALGTVTIVLTYLLARRLAGSAAGAIAAALAAGYPAFIDNAGRMLAEPVALVWLPAAVLAFLWASEGGRVARWMLPGALLGLTTLTRPEYLPFAVVFGVLAVLRVTAGEGRGARAGLGAAALLLGAFCAVLAPWTLRNHVVLDRFVPVTTGGGNALFIGTYLPGDGRHLLVKRELIERHTGQRVVPWNQVLATDIKPLLAREAARYPHLETDAALARIGRENLVAYATERPADYAWMVVRKMLNMWERGSTPAMTGRPWVAYHRAVVLWALAALAGLAWLRRWEALVIGALVVGITLVGGLLLAVPRRALPLMPLVLALCAVAIVWLAAAVSSARRRRSARCRPRGRTHGAAPG